MKLLEFCEKHLDHKPSLYQIQMIEFLQEFEDGKIHIFPRPRYGLTTILKLYKEWKEQNESK